MADAGRVKGPRTTFDALRNMGVLSSTPLHVDTSPPPDITNVAMLEDAQKGTCAAEPLDESESSAKPYLPVKTNATLVQRRYERRERGAARSMQIRGLCVAP